MAEFMVYEDMMSDVYDEDFGDEIVLEGYQNKSPQNGELWLYNFDHYNGKSGRDGIKERRVLILPDKRFGQMAVMIGSYGNFSDNESIDPKKKENRPLSYKIPDPEVKGFTKKVFVNCAGLRKLSEGTPLRPLSKSLTNDDIAIVKKKIEEFEKIRYTTPWMAMNWFNYICLEGDETNDNPLKSFSDVKNSERANCVDLAYFIHLICAKHRNQNRIVKFTAVENQNHSEGHLCTIFGDDRKYIFRYITPYGKSHIGDCFTYKSSSFEKTTDEERKYMAGIFKNHPRLKNKNFTTSYYILSKSDIRVWDDYVKNKKTQRDLMSIIDRSAQGEKILLPNINI